MGLRTTYLGKAEIQELLGTNSFGMWRLPRQHGDFPEPETDIYYGPFDVKPDGPVWDAHDVYRWAARTPEFQHRGAVLLRPLPGQRQPGASSATRTPPTVLPPTGTPASASSACSTPARATLPPPWPQTWPTSATARSSPSAPVRRPQPRHRPGSGRRRHRPAPH
ncbi:hypothetical protein ACFQ0M_49245 [Kitasatospora aburaviensis]